MAEEIEVKFLDTNHDEIRAKLLKLGAKKTHERTLHKRKVYDYIDGSLEKKGGWVRLRDEGDKITLTYKQNNFDSSGDVIKTLEDEVIVGDYDGTNRLLLSIGLKEKSTQENYREVWQINVDDSCVDVMLDEWAFLKPFIELELVSGVESALRVLASQLDLRYQDSVMGGIIPVYMSEYDVTDREIRDYRGPMTFDQPKPPFLKK